jgi:hypothetical protein
MDHTFLFWYSYSSSETGVVFHGGSKFDRFDRMDRSFDRRGRMILLNLLLRKWLGTGLTPLVLTPMLSRLLALALGFELQVGGPENIWFISGVVIQPHTPVVTWRYITFWDGGQGRVNCEEMTKVIQFVTSSVWPWSSRLVCFTPCPTSCV